MQAIFNGTVLAESDDIVVVDGNAYFPRDAMRTVFFVPQNTYSLRLERRLATGMWWWMVRSNNVVGVTTPRAMLSGSVSGLPSTAAGGWW